jgi:hypothetical protein
MLPEQTHIALKEWAVTVKALAQGQQILLLRKGGIHESSKDFRVIHPEFLLYPTYEHQRQDLLKEANQDSLQMVLEESRQEDRITFSHWTRVEETIEVSEQQKVDDLSPYYIWTEAYAQSRLRWKPMLPLSVMLLRVHRLERPVSVPFLPEYRGCTSWVEVLDPVPLGQMEPVLTDPEFRNRVDEIKERLGQERSLSK